MIKSLINLGFAVALCLGAAGFLVYAWRSSAPPLKDAAVPPASSPAAPTAPALPRNLLAEWRSFSLLPPLYGAELLRLYSDFSCTVEVPAAGTSQACRWQREPGDRLRLSFPTGNQQVQAALWPPESTAGKAKGGSAAYLTLDLPSKQRKLLVLGESPDDAMVRATIDGEAAWTRRDFQNAMRAFLSAVDQGGAYARLRLGWLLASSGGYRDPTAALQVLSPLEGTADYQVQTALAAAYAGAGKFKEAVGAGERACNLADKAQQPECTARLVGYKAGQPLALAPADTPVGTATPVAPTAPTPTAAASAAPAVPAWPGRAADGKKPAAH